MNQYPLIRGENDLASCFPDIAAEWDSELNGDISPQDVQPMSDQKFWWIGDCGHSWNSQIANRSNGCGCPYCSGRKVLPGFNDLETLSPDLASEWDYEKNGTLTPRDVTDMSNRKVWWRCELGHEWEASIYDRHKSGCPYCSNRKVLPGFNDLATLYPELAAEWDYEKNGNLKPTEVVPGSHKKAWWRCVKDHEWQTKIEDRCKGKGYGCPECARLIDRHPVIPGESDLATYNPELAAEWDYQRNGELTPDQIRPFSTRKVWWVCNNGHHWQCAVQIRERGHGCPFCEGRIHRQSRLI